MTSLGLDIGHILLILHRPLFCLVALQLDRWEDRCVVGAARLLDEVSNGRFLVPSCNSLLLFATTLLRSHFGKVGGPIRTSSVMEDDADSVLPDLPVSPTVQCHLPVLVILRIFEGMQQRHGTLQRGDFLFLDGIEPEIVERTSPQEERRDKPLTRVVLNLGQRNGHETADASTQLQLAALVDLPRHKDPTITECSPSLPLLLRRVILGFGRIHVLQITDDRVEAVYDHAVRDNAHFFNKTRFSLPNTCSCLESVTLLQKTDPILYERDQNRFDLWRTIGRLSFAIDRNSNRPDRFI